MSESGLARRFFQYALIVAYSGAIVLIGARELYQIHMARHVKEEKSSPELLSELRGDIDIGRASMSPEYVEETVKKGDSKLSERVPDTSTLRALKEKLVP